MKLFFDKLWHGTFKRPYHLSIPIDKGKGTPIIFIHGLGSSSAIWRYTIDYLQNDSYRIIAIDLLGFGNSPKPSWLDYDIVDHTRSIIAEIDNLRLPEPPILVGHSMGCLIAVHIARLRPDLARHLVLYEMPLYDGLPEKRIYRIRLNAYRALYERITNYDPVFTSGDTPLVQRIGSRLTGFDITKETWPPFRKSLQNTIMSQTAGNDINHITVAMDVIYGLRDMLVIRGKAMKIFGQDSSTRVRSYTINAAHNISKSASKFIASRIIDITLS